ncbi:hypothetical protein PENPOL_c007G03828 [Penicillium polonicum]|uniref:Uncharacterized protein n=1 Tax=Penicillium polonicum TaxID=60169 RepID=A0A1V6NIC7_PENPO|nr:hypothetical protein PENPOL_c007G03828 [Penicillium polonicum]
MSAQIGKTADFVNLL